MISRIKKDGQVVFSEINAKGQRVERVEKGKCNPESMLRLFMGMKRTRRFRGEEKLKKNQTLVAYGCRKNCFSKAK